jgi:hypothetical protein
VALVPARFEPEIELPPISSYTTSTLKGAGAGLLGGTLVGAGLGATAGCTVTVVTGPFWALICPVFVVGGAAGGAVVGLVGGTALGAAKGAPTSQTVDAKKSLQPAMAALKVQQPLADAVQSGVKDAAGEQLAEFSSIGPTAKGQQVDYRVLASQGFESVLETSVTRFGFDSAGGKDPEVALFMVVHARRVDAQSGKELWSGEFAYLSRYAPLPVWAEGEQALVKSEYPRAYHALGERIVEKVFLHTARMHAESTGSSLPEARPVCGVRPVEPALETRTPPSTPEEVQVVDIEVESLQPTLRWEPFNLHDELVHSRADTASAGAVRYDLRVWKTTSASTIGELVYEQRDIADPWHTLLQPLEAGSKYFWSVRARYADGDSVYATRWSESRLPLFALRTAFLPSVYADRSSVLKQMGASVVSVLDLHANQWSPCALDFIPDANYYRFRTKPIDAPESATTTQPGAPARFSPVGTGAPPSREPYGMLAQGHATATRESSSPPPAASPPSSQAPPPAARAPVAAGIPRVGDRWRYRLTDGGAVRGIVTIEVMEVGGGTVTERITREGYSGMAIERVADANFATRHFQTPVSMQGGYQLWEMAPYFSPGTTLTAGENLGPISGEFLIPGMGKRSLVSQAQVVGEETVRVPAGQFHAWRVKTVSQTAHGVSQRAVITCNFWYSPEISRTVKMTSETQWDIQAVRARETYELLAFEAAK